MTTNVVPSDLKNVYVWDTARKMLPYLSNKLMMEGKRGRKFEPVSLGDAASMAIMEACERRGLSLLPAGPSTTPGTAPLPESASGLRRKGKVKK